MDSRQKKQLKRQLEGQASLLVSENSDVALVAGLLTTCSALLRTAEQNMPAAFTNQEFDQIYAGYLGLAGGVNRFSRFGQGYLSQNYKTLLQEQMDKATQLQQERKTLEDQLTQTQHQQAETQQAVTQLKGQRPGGAPGGRNPESPAYPGGERPPKQDRSSESPVGQSPAPEGAV